MTISTSATPEFLRAVRTFLVVSGAVTLVAGIALLVWPAKSAVLVTGIVAAYLIIGGLSYLALGIFSGSDSGWARTGHVLLGLLYVVAGVVAFANLAAATVSIALIVSILIGVSWIGDAVVALSLLSHSRTKAWTVLYAVISLLAGITVLLAPLYAATVLWLILGVTLVVLGIGQLVRAFTLRKASPVAPVDAGL